MKNLVILEVSICDVLMVEVEPYVVVGRPYLQFNMGEIQKALSKISDFAVKHIRLHIAYPRN